MIEPRASVTRFVTAVVRDELVRDGAGADSGVAQRIVMRLHVKLGKLVGPAGFDVLLARALVLARPGHPSLAGITAGPGGVLTGLDDAGLSPHITEFLADVLVLQRYVELEGKLEKVLAVVKMRTSRHDTSIRRYAIEPSGVVVGEPVHGYSGVLTGVPLVRAEGVASRRG